MAIGDSIAMQRMQEEAMQRAREMRQRNRFPEEPEEDEEAPEAASEPESGKAEEPAIQQPKDALDPLLADKERTLILLLMVILGDSGNNDLLFALMFLLI